MKKILIISYGESDKNGGVASLCDLTNACFELGYKVTFLSPFAKLDRLIYKRLLLKKGIQRKTIPFLDVDNRIYLHSGFKLVIQKLASILFGSVCYEDFDFIIDGLGLSPEILCNLKNKNIKVIRNHAGSPAAFYDFFLNPKPDSTEEKRKKFYNSVMGNYSGGLFQSKSHMDEFLMLTKLNPNDSVFIPPTVSEKFDAYLNNFDSAAYKNNYKLVMVGSIQPRKGQLHAVKLLSILNDPKYELHLFGNVLDDAYFQELKSYINQNNLIDKVFIKGFSSHYIRELAESSCLLMMSRAEGVPRVVREALSLNVPVIGYKFGDICNQISENNGGYFVDYGSYEKISDVIFTKVPNMQGRRAYAEVFSRNSYMNSLMFFLTRGVDFEH
jgi:glycosyltransferase involved in cell wall biosynthesis